MIFIVKKKVIIKMKKKKKLGIINLIKILIFIEILIGKLLPFVLKTIIYPLITSILDIVFLKNNNILILVLLMNFCHYFQF